MGAPSVGRDHELRAIADVADSVLRERRPAGILVLGEPGMGKTRLLAEAGEPAGFVQRLPVQGYEPERNVPLAAAREMLRRLSDSADLEVDPIAVMADDRSATLEPIRLFELVHRAMRKRGPAVLTIDDLQWVDELSLALCHYLVRAAASCGAVPDDGGGRPAFAQSRNVRRRPAAIAWRGSVPGPRARADRSR